MFISKAYAQAVETGADMAAQGGVGEASPMSYFFENLMVLGFLVGIFYFLFILPQQRRFKEHAQKLAELKKGDRVVTGGGLVGKVDKLVDDKELIVDLGGGMKVTALRSTLQTGQDAALGKKPANKNTKKDTKPKSKDTK